MFQALARRSHLQSASKGSIVLVIAAAIQTHRRYLGSLSSKLLWALLFKSRQGHHMRVPQWTKSSSNSLVVPCPYPARSNLQHQSRAMAS